MNIQRVIQRTTLLPGGREQFICNAAFLALFPGFFFYHTLLGTGTTGAFLGGYFSPVSLLFLLPLASVLLRRFRRIPRHIFGIEIHLNAFLTYFFVVIVMQAVAGANMPIVTNHVLSILFIGNAFIIFSTIDFASNAFRIMGLITLGAMSIIAFSYSVNGVFYLGAIGVAKDADSMATYQGFARSYLVTFLAVIAFTRSLPLRLVLYSTGAATLYVNTARSEFAALLFSIPLLEFYYSRHKILFVMIAAFIVILLNFYIDQLIAALPDNRILELLDLSQSTSANKRHHLSVHAMQTIAAHPLLGDYASYTPGYYSHNVLSAWVDLGLFGFIYLNALLVFPAIPMFLREYFSGRYNGNFILGFSLVCCTLLLLITSHYFTDMLIGATVGAYVQYENWRKYGKHRTPDIGASSARHAHLHQTVPEHGSVRT